MAISLQNLLASIGIVTVGAFLYNVSSFAYLYLRPSSLSRYLRTSSSGQETSARAWALVTGASDGIGKGFAQELCARGFNVVIHGRNEKKLKGVREDLQREYPQSEVKILVLDAASTPWTAKSDKAVLSTVQDLNLTVLINNVGGSGGIKPEFELLQRSTAQELDTWFNVNARFPVQLTRVLLPILTQKQPALIINIGSAAEFLPSAYIAVYAGTKAFISAWTRSLKAEMKAEGFDVEVFSAIVARVVTETSRWGKDEAGFFAPVSRGMAKACLDRVGADRANVIPFLGHALQLAGFTRLPERSREKIMIKISKSEMELRAKDT